MVYQLRNMHLSLPQVKTLVSGGSIRLLRQHLAGGPHRIHLTKTQHANMNKAFLSGKGISLKMSQAQVKHNAKGGNIFSRVYKGIKHFVGRPRTREAVVNMMRVPSSIRALPKLAVGALLRRGANHMGNRYLPGMGSVVEGLADRGLKMVGLGVKRKRKRKGGNIFSSIGNFFKRPSNILGALGTVARFTPLSALSAPLALASMGAKMGGHGIKRRRRRVFKRVGGSFLLK